MTTDIATAYFRNLELTGDPQAAATLTLAEVTAGNREPVGGMLTVAEAAEFLNVSQWTVRNLVDVGRLPASRTGKGRGVVRFKKADLEWYQKESTGCRPIPATYTTRLLPPRPDQK